MKTIPVAEPCLGSEENANVLAALQAGALSGHAGPFVRQFEEGFAAYCGCSHGIAVSSGTTALHLALAALGITRGDEVLVSTLTNMATFFAVLYLGATPIPVDIEPDTLNLDPGLIAAKITPRTRAILVVHLFGHPVDMEPVQTIAAEHGLPIIEDCAEAHGAEYNGQRVGSLGTIGCFSFYANKIITTGEGGMCTTSDGVLAERMRSLRSLAFGSDNKFMHREIGFSYRMTNLQAAVGCAQLAKLDYLVERKRAIAAAYHRHLAGSPELRLPVEMGYAHSVYWMYHLVLTGRVADRRPEIMSALVREGIETRETFIPYNLQEHLPGASDFKNDCPRANQVAYRGFYLPTGPLLSEDEITHVATTLLRIIAGH